MFPKMIHKLLFIWLFRSLLPKVINVTIFLIPENMEKPNISQNGTNQSLQNI